MESSIQKLSFTCHIESKLAVLNRYLYIVALLAMLVPDLATAAVGFAAGIPNVTNAGSPYFLAPIDSPNFGQYRETVEDIKVKVMGGYYRVNRSWDAGKWYINESLDKFELKFTQSISATSQYATVYYEGEKYGDVVVQTDQTTGVRSFQLPASETEIGYSKLNQRRLIWTGSAFRVIDKWGYWTEFYSPGDVIISHVYAARQGDRNNVQVSFQYGPSNANDGGNKVITGVLDNFGKQIIWFEYNDPTKPRDLSAIRDYTGRRVEYRYSGGQLTEVVDVRGNSWTYTYEKSGSIDLLKTKTDPDGRTITINYGPAGGITSILNPDGTGAQYKFEFLLGKNQYYRQEKTTGGKVTEMWLDSVGDIIREDINGVTTKSITQQGQYKTITDRSGNSIKEEYDQWDNLVKRTYPDNSFITRKYDTKYSLLLEEGNEKGVITKYAYDANGNVKSKTEAAGLPEQRIISYTYDQYGNMLSNTYEADALSAKVVYAWTYDDFGNQKTYTDGENNVWSYSYDVLGNVLTETEPASTKVWEVTYDAAGNKTSIKDPLGHLIQYVYDGRGNKTKFTDAKSHSTSYTYDGNNRLTKVTDPLNNDIKLDYNVDGKLIKVTDQDNKYISLDYDLEGRYKNFKDGSNNSIELAFVAENTNGAGKVAVIHYPTVDRSFSYDARGRIISVIDSQSTTQIAAFKITYDAVGNLKNVIDKNKREHNYTFDALNRLTHWIDPLKQETIFVYDNRDNLKTYTDTKGNITTYSYNGNDLFISELRPMGQELTYAFDSSSRLSTYIDAKGQKIQYLYDDAGRLETINEYISTTATTPQKSVHFDHDEVDLLTGYNDGVTSAIYSYDELDRKTSETVNFGSFSKSIGYTYTKNSQKQSYTTPDGTKTTYSYNPSNKLSSIQIPGIGAITLDAYEWQQPKTVNLPGGVAGEYSYDALQRLLAYNIKDPAKNSIMSASYVRDPIGNITNIDTEHGAYKFDYDALDRLTHVDNPNLVDETYTYDPMGNRLSDSNLAGDWGYNKNNQLTSVGTDITYVYDDNGSAVSKTVAGTTTDYVYNLRNRLSEVKQGASTIATYSYDPFGQRISKNVAGQVTYFLYSDEGLVAEFDATGAIVKQYGYRPDSQWGVDPAYLKTGGQYYFYQNNYLGTPNKLTAVNGSVVWSAEYQAFGNLEVAGDSTVQNNLRFPGQYYDEETQLNYNWHRVYDPVTGRYITSDPLGIDGGWNTYLYADANPITNMDNEGKFLVIPVLIGGAIGGVCAAITSQGDVNSIIEGVISGMLPGLWGAAAGAISSQFFKLPLNSCVSDRAEQSLKDAASSYAGEAAGRESGRISDSYDKGSNKAARNMQKDVMTRVRNQRYFKKKAVRYANRAARNSGVAGCVVGALADFLF